MCIRDRYNDIKSKYPKSILLFRVGDFYETFHEDAVIASQVLGIVLTKRGSGVNKETKLAGFPYHSLDTYLHKLVKAGHRVAICEQLENPKLTKKIVKRGVTDLITPGVSLNDEILTSKKNNFLAAVNVVGDQIGLSLLDVSTGDFFLSQGSLNYILSLIKNFDPKEILISKNDLKLILDRKASPEGYHVSSDGQISFSDDETKLYFGLALPEIYQDTLLLKEEIVDVEVWTFDEPRLYTIQEMQLNNDKKKSFKSVYNFDNEKVVQIANKDFPNAIISEHGNGEYALISNPQPYQLSSQWTALFSKNDLAVKNIKNGDSEIVIKGNPSLARLSPQGYYAYGYNQVDSTWYTHNLKKSKYTELTRGKIFYNELSDYPNYPSSYGIAGWSKNDKTIFIYDLSLIHI